MRLTAGVRSQLTLAIDSAEGREVCGFIAENGQGQQAFLRARNLAPRPGSFLVDPPERDRIERAAASRALRMIAFVHSHPYSLELSASDRIALDAGRLPWIVVAVREGVLCHKVHYPGTQPAHSDGRAGLGTGARRYVYAGQLPRGGQATVNWHD